MKRYLIFIVGLILFSACSVMKSDGTANHLQGTRWVLYIIDQEILDADSLGRFLPTLEIDSTGSRVTGNAACNGYGGIIELGADSLQFGPLMSTKMACSALELEQRFMRQINTKTVKYSRKQGNLILYGEEETLVFHPAE